LKKSIGNEDYQRNKKNPNNTEEIWSPWNLLKQKEKEGKDFDWKYANEQYGDD